ncbi:MAG: DUF4377 domain-containing protein [Candidatus Azobacteroides sp.]|nr:DUF4377 domain-containing protein [Candidatus Azobacteroides sp.]
MKTLLKYFLFLFGLLFLTFGCNEEDKSEILTVASERPKPSGYEISPTYWVKFQGENEWRTIVGPIIGFNYVKGYEYKIEVKKIEVKKSITRDMNFKQTDCLTIIF